MEGATIGTKQRKIWEIKFQRAGHSFTGFCLEATVQVIILYYLPMLRPSSTRSIKDKTNYTKPLYIDRHEQIHQNFYQRTQGKRKISFEPREKEEEHHSFQSMTRIQSPQKIYNFSPSISTTRSTETCYSTLSTYSPSDNLYALLN